MNATQTTTSYRVPLYVWIEADSPADAVSIVEEALDAGEFLFEGEIEGMLGSYLGNTNDVEHVPASQE